MLSTPLVSARLNLKRPIKRLTFNHEQLDLIVAALVECLEGDDDYERSNICIHELILSDGKRAQILMEIEQEDSQGNFPSELEYLPSNSCIETEH